MLISMKRQQDARCVMGRQEAVSEPYGVLKQAHQPARLGQEERAQCFLPHGWDLEVQKGCAQGHTAGRDKSWILDWNPVPRLLLGTSVETRKTI